MTRAGVRGGCGPPARTLVRPVARGAASGDAAHMSRRLLSRAAPALRTCPFCRSSAVRASESEAVEEGGERFQLQCGECDTWRRLVLGPRAAAALRRSLDRDLRRVSRALEDPVLATRR